MLHPISSRTAVKADPVIIAQHNRIMRWLLIFMLAGFASMAVCIWAAWLNKTGQITRLNESWLMWGYFTFFSAIASFTASIMLYLYGRNLPHPMHETHREHVHYEQIVRPARVAFEARENQTIRRKVLNLENVSTEQLISFARIAQANDWTMTRNLAKGVKPRLININQRYGEILAELKRLDYADINSREVVFTDAGITAMLEMMGD